MSKKTGFGTYSPSGQATICAVSHSAGASAYFFMQSHGFFYSFYKESNRQNYLINTSSVLVLIARAWCNELINKPCNAFYGQELQLNSKFLATAEAYLSNPFCLINAMP